MALLLPDRLQTQRLTLRAPRQADAARMFEAYTHDLDVARYLVWRPHQVVGETEAFVAWCIDQWDGGRSRPYILAHRDNEDLPIGMLEARLFAHTIDIGYVLQRAYWGAGRMSEAVDAVSAAGLAHPDCFRIQATCDTDNHASARALERCGFTREGRLARHAVLPNLGAEPRPSLMYARCR